MKSTPRKRHRSRRALVTQFHQRRVVLIELESARWHLLNRRPERAEQSLRRALGTAPGHPEATSLLSQILIPSGRSREAFSLLHDAVRRNPTEAILRIELAETALLVNRLDEAEREATKFLDLLQRQPGALSGRRRALTSMARGLIAHARERAASPDARATAKASPAEPVAPAAAAPAPASTASETLESMVRFEGQGADLSAPAWSDDPWSGDLEDRELLLTAQRIGLLSHYEDLLCLDVADGLQRLEFQIETARRILRRLNGRALLCDEVGLGKTIEAGLVIKEYLMRGLVRNVLVLVPAGLVRQWCEEMAAKFSLQFAVWGERDVNERDGREPLLAIVSIATARLDRNREIFCEKEWDLVVVDEAHHLRRRSTRSWKLVSSLRKRFVLLLSATPVHGNLMELYELVTLVRPGLLGTPAEFRRNHLADAAGRRPKNPERLREALSEVMVRNTRSHADVVLPKRFATTLVLEAPQAEADACRAATAYARLVYQELDPLGKMRLRHLLGCAGSGPLALAAAAARWREGIGGAAGGSGAEDARALLSRIEGSARAAGGSAKAARLLEMARASSEQMIVFCRFRATVDELAGALAEAGIAHAVYHGELPRAGKDRAIETFRSGAQILLSTESGGEGRNLHFCRTVLNYDLPWDPMLIEQRIGRVHRIGQQRDVFVFNFVLAGTVEEELLRILDEKIHMFELIIGEVDSILGHLERREEFADILLDLWAGSVDEAERRRRFESFGMELEAARASYEREKKLDESLFSDSLEV